MGQELIRRHGQSPTPMWSAQVLLEAPELVRTLHEDFIRAGADMITVNAYSATPERLDRDGHASLFEPLQQAACTLAQQARDNCAMGGTLIAGCLPPLVGSYYPDAAPDKQQSLINYRRIVEQQADHVDLFVCETMSSISEATYAATAAAESGKPVWLALSLDDDKPECLRSGELLSEALTTIRELPVQALLLNCSKPETISKSWGLFNSGTGLPTGAYANGFTSVTALNPGGTVTALEARQDLDPDAYAQFAMKWVAEGATIVGGCCEVGPEHVKRIHEQLGRS